MEIEQGKLRLEVRLYGPARTVETNYGPREERDKLVDLDLPVTGMAWEYIHYLVTQYGKPDISLFAEQNTDTREGA